MSRQVNSEASYLSRRVSSGDNTALPAEEQPLIAIWTQASFLPPSPVPRTEEPVSYPATDAVYGRCVDGGQQPPPRHGRRHCCTGRTGEKTLLTKVIQTLALAVVTDIIRYSLIHYY